MYIVYCAPHYTLLDCGDTELEISKTVSVMSVPHLLWVNCVSGLERFRILIVENCKRKHTVLNVNNTDTYLGLPNPHQSMIAVRMRLVKWLFCQFEHVYQLSVA